MDRIAHIIACGKTGANWDGSGFSIGVNDCWKFMKPTNRLIVVNSFKPFPDRLKIINESMPKDGLYSHIGHFSRHPKYKYIGVMQRWKGRFNDGVLYHSNTSPFIAVSMAHNLGYDNIVLWGVDLVDHPKVNGQSLKMELDQWKSFITILNIKGTRVYLGTDYGALNFLPVWSGQYQQPLMQR